MAGETESASADLGANSQYTRLPQHGGAPPGYPFPQPVPVQGLYSSYSSTNSGPTAQVTLAPLPESARIAAQALVLRRLLTRQQAGASDTMEFGRVDKQTNSVLF